MVRARKLVDSVEIGEQKPSERVYVERPAGGAWIKAARIDDVVVASALAEAKALRRKASKAVWANAAKARRR